MFVILFEQNKNCILLIIRMPRSSARAERALIFGITLQIHFFKLRLPIKNIELYKFIFSNSPRRAAARIGESDHYTF